MKINVESQGSAANKLLFSRFFSNIYYFFLLHIYVVLALAGAALSIALILFVAELLFPRAVHLFNYSVTDKVFDELVADHKYHAAISLMDTKQELIESSDDSFRFLITLADCYTHTGDYPKALEQYRILRKRYEEESAKDTSTPPDEKKLTDNFLNLNFLKEEFRIYMKMGDIASVRRHYAEMKAIHEATDWQQLNDNLASVDNKFYEAASGKFNLADGYRLELIQGLYFSEPDRAITECKEYSLRILDSDTYRPDYKLRLLNELLCMLLEHDRSIEARLYLEYALRIVDSLEYDSAIFGELGELSDYCAMLNDVADGHRLLRKYLHHIDSTYDKNDIEYALAHAKEFRYLEADGDWERLTVLVAESSAALSRQIARNFTGMTSAQREYFISRFRPLLEYADRLMERHPSDRLASVCFENNMFLRGLLLRSSSAVANAIAAMGDTVLSAKYDRYVEASRELVARQYVGGPGNYLARQLLESEVRSLEEEIANASLSFRRENESATLSADQLRKSLGPDDVVMQIIESHSTVFALLMDRSGTVTYRPVASRDSLMQLSAIPGAIYTDSEAVSRMFASITPLIAGKNVYLTPSGIFNRISFGALPVGPDGRIFADIARIHTVGSPADIPSVKSAEAMTFTARNAILWGGVDYAAAGSLLYLPAAPDTPASVSPASASPASEPLHPADTTLTRGILRGDILRRLPASLDEVQGIASLLRRAGSHTQVYHGSAATERSFTSRHRRRDYILHISTHGFFHDSGTFTDPMRNSGLLFAGSQPYWSATDTSLPSIRSNDGILRADEIAALDLSGCRLVVLSACRTGLGAYDSEGVYGLQRAFRLAGVRTILMSLWSVDDAATRDLMTEFYRHLTAGLTPDDALRAAQSALRARGLPPSHWGAFILLNS